MRRSAIWTRWWVFVNLAREPRFSAAASRDGRVAGPPAASPVLEGRVPADVHAALAAAHARDRAADVGDRRACRQPPPRSSGHPDDAEPLRVGVRGRRAAHRRAVAAADARLEDRMSHRSLAPRSWRRSTAAASTPRSATWGCGSRCRAELRLTEFSPRTLPDHPAFRWRLGCRPEWRGFDLQPLPEPMQRDFAYCLWRVIDSGLTITAPYARLVNWLIRLAEEHGRGGRRAGAFADRPLASRLGARADQGARTAHREAWLAAVRARDLPALLPASADRLRPARVVAARRVEPTVRRADPAAPARAHRGACRLRLPGHRAALVARGAEVAAEDRA